MPRRVSKLRCRKPNPNLDYCPVNVVDVRPMVYCEREINAPGVGQRIILFGPYPEQNEKPMDINDEIRSLNKAFVELNDYVARLYEMVAELTRLSALQPPPVQSRQCHRIPLDSTRLEPTTHPGRQPEEHS